MVEGLSNCHCLQHILLGQNNLQQVNPMNWCCAVHGVMGLLAVQVPLLVNHVLLRELSLEENSISDVTPITGAWLPLLQSLCLANNW